MRLAIEQFPFVSRDPLQTTASLAPMLPLELSARSRVAVSGLVDSGAAINVLPFSIGQQLGFDWDKQSKVIELSGKLAAVEARVVVANATIGKLPEVRLAFGWAKSDSIPLILGQVNFFLEFDVCMFRARSIFEVRSKLLQSADQNKP